jgi:hypothetical protein
MNIYGVSMPSHYDARKQVSLPPVTDNASTGQNQPGEAETSQVWQGAATLLERTGLRGDRHNCRPAKFAREVPLNMAFDLVHIPSSADVASTSISGTSGQGSLERKFAEKPPLKRNLVQKCTHNFIE